MEKTIKKYQALRLLKDLNLAIENDEIGEYSFLVILKNYIIVIDQ